MKIIKHTPFVWQYLNVASDDQIESITSGCKQYMLNDDTIPSREQTFSVRNTSFNLTELVRFHPNLKSRAAIYEIDQNIHNIYCAIQRDYTEKNALFKYTLSAARVTGFRTNYHYRNYTLKQEYKWHCDFHSSQRFILSGLLYLNDDFDGGGTRFLMDRLTVQPIKGSLLMFPCGPYFVHRSVPIKNGEKNIIWTCFDRVSQDIQR
ncbi:2OG-Fe(II) oxygenase [Synechococcus phage ACG-2014h]|uniref:2OG-Fe(II) oxygenase n=1 Tax=Synechococcus phage ACG-2014h TaxID=1340810 RepID=V5UTP4_9CAUD|nr:2OG-Fe(II) oxygenase [Synechococcus phage ACG-2014h]AHB80439.1 2OG-Fe(II) oxygenase [Synechococcus phage ACG-2014h]